MNSDNVSFSLRKNFLWTLSGNTVYLACQWGFIILFSKIGTVEMVGQFVLGLAISVPVFMFTNLGLRSVIVTDAKNIHQFSEYFSLRLCSTFVALAIISLIVLLTQYDNETKWVIFLIAICKAIEAISDIIFGQFQKKERMKLIAISLMQKGILSIAFLSFFLWLTKSIVVSVVSLAVTWLLVLIFNDLRIILKHNKIMFLFKSSNIIPLIKLCLPLGLVMMLTSSLENIPRYFIQYLIGTEALGYFAAIVYIKVIGNSIVNALGQTASPRLAKYYILTNKSAYRKLLIKLVVLSVVLGLFVVIIVLIFGKQILSLIYQEEYTKYYFDFFLIILASAISYTSSFLGYGMTAARFFKIQPLVTSIVVLFCIIFNAYLIPTMGFTGAAYAMIITATMHLLVSVLVTIYIWNQKTVINN